MSLLRSSPLKQGIDPASIKATFDKWREYDMDLHSFMLIKNGHVVSEVYVDPYKPTIPHLLNSLSKSFAATAIGIAAGEQRLSLDDSIISFFPEYITDDIQKNMSKLKVRHLLSMSTGHDQDTTEKLRQSEDWVNTFLNIPITYEPGTYFLYNTGASYMLSAILHAATGEHLLDYLQPRLFDPLGLIDITTETCPNGIHAGGYGMSVKTEDIAKFGLLYLQKGKWNNKQLIPEWFVEEATTKQVSNGDAPDSDWTQGYGYQFWQCRHAAYRADGAFGQFCIIIPEHNAVIVTTAGVMETHDMIQVIWDELLPGLSVDASSIPFVVHEELQTAIANYRYIPMQMQQESTQLHIWQDASFAIAPNESDIIAMKFHFTEQESSLTIRTNQSEQVLNIGHGKWIHQQLELNGVTLPVAMSGAWLARNKFSIEVRMVSKPYSDHWLCHFVGDNLRVTHSRNVWTTPNSPLSKPYLPQLMGARLKEALS